MADKDNTLKKDAPKKETTPKEKVEKPVEMRKVMTEEEAEKVLAKERGEEPKAPEKKEPEIPERYKGKTAEELVKLLDEKENFIQSRSDEMGELREEAKETVKLKEKVAKIEEETLKGAQVLGKLPERPVAPVITDEEYYEDPPKALKKVTEYNKKLADYVDQITSAKTAPIYHITAERGKEKLYKDLEAKYKDSPVKFDRKKVQEFLDKNPEYFKTYKTGAYEQAYHDISLPEIVKARDKMREEVKAEVMEEIKTGKQATSVGFNDLETPQSGEAKEYDKVKMEEDPEYRKQMIDDMEKRKREGKI